MSIGGITVATTVNAAAAETQRQHEENVSTKKKSSLSTGRTPLTVSGNSKFRGRWRGRSANANICVGLWRPRLFVGGFWSRKSATTVCGSSVELEVHYDDFNPDIDPYRTHDGTGDTGFLIAVMTITTGSLALEAAILMFALGG